MWRRRCWTQTPGRGRWQTPFGPLTWLRTIPCLQLVRTPETWGLEDGLPFSEGSFAAGLWSVWIIAIYTVAFQGCSPELWGISTFQNDVTVTPTLLGSPRTNGTTWASVIQHLCLKTCPAMSGVQRKFLPGDPLGTLFLLCSAGVKGRLCCFGKLQGNQVGRW